MLIIMVRYALHWIRLMIGIAGAITMYVAIPADADGVRVEGEWDPLGMRGTVSRTLIFEDVFVPFDAQLVPAGIYPEAASRWPHMFMTLTPSYMGIAQACYDFTVAYLRGEIEGMPPVKQRMYSTKQLAVAQMRVMLEQTKALWFQVISRSTTRPVKEQPDAGMGSTAYGNGKCQRPCPAGCSHLWQPVNASLSAARALLP